jgi:hypothetical protein
VIRFAAAQDRPYDAGRVLQDATLLGEGRGPVTPDLEGPRESVAEIEIQPTSVGREGDAESSGGFRRFAAKQKVVRPEAMGRHRGHRRSRKGYDLPFFVANHHRGEGKAKAEHGGDLRQHPLLRLGAL